MILLVSSQDLDKNPTHKQSLFEDREMVTHERPEGRTSGASLRAIGANLQS